MTLNQQVKKVKNHVDANKRTYIAVGLGLVGAAAAGFAAGRFGSTGSNALAIQQIKQIGWHNENVAIINLVERSTPSKPVHLVGTNLYFDSLSDAARKTGHSLQSVSQNANGHIPNVKGDVFEFLQLG